MKLQLQYITLKYLKFTLHRIALPYITLTLHYTTLHCITLLYFTWHNITLPYLTSHYIKLYYFILLTLHSNFFFCYKARSRPTYSLHYLQLLMLAKCGLRIQKFRDRNSNRIWNKIEILIEICFGIVQLLSHILVHTSSV